MLLALAAHPWAPRTAQPRGIALRLCWTITCALVAVFPLLPVDVGDQTVRAGLAGAAPHARRLTMRSCVAPQWAVVLGAVAVAAAVVANEALLPSARRASTAAVVLLTGALLTAAWVVHDTTERLASKRGLPPLNQGLAWVLTLAAPLLSRASGDAWRSRFAFVAGSLAVPLTLLSVSYVTCRRCSCWGHRRDVRYRLRACRYEMLFFAGYATLLLLWVELESRQAAAAGAGEALFRADHLRQVLVFVMLLLVSFFGTGNIASISSFEISSTCVVGLNGDGGGVELLLTRRCLARHAGTAT